MVHAETERTQNATLADIRQWYADGAGRQVLESGRAILDQLLPGLFGYHLLQLSVSEDPLYGNSTISHKVCMGLTPGDRNVVASPAQLPFDDDSIDVVVLHHMLDFCDAPQTVLREVSRVTLSGGHVIIVGFNPVSPWGLARAALGWRSQPPWNGSFIRMGRLMDWLNLLDFRIDRAEFAHHVLPFRRLKRLPDYSQGLSRRINWPFGAVYVLVACKQVAGMTPIKPVWRSGGTSLGSLHVVRPRASVRLIKHLSHATPDIACAVTSGLLDRVTRRASGSGVEFADEYGLRTIHRRFLQG